MVYRMVKHVLCSNLATCGSRFIGILAPLTVPPLHILFFYHFWQDFARDVDRQFCSCSCWDTVFKGSYESGIASYKHMYFNATSNTLKMWAIVVVGIVAFYESSKYLTWLAFHARLRTGMFVLFVSAIYSHYYAWWAYINYWNDEFYSQWYHQMFFSVTELISTTLVILLADKKTPITNRKAFSISAIALVHIFAGSWDQFVQNVLRGEGYAHQVIRDLGLMIPDILHVLIPLLSLRWRGTCSLPTSECRNTSMKGDLMFMLCMILIGLAMCALL